MLKYFCVGCLVVLAGCGDSSSGPRTVDAAGVVTLDGSPVDKAQVIFIDDSAQFPASSTTDTRGHFSLSLNGEKKGAVPGSYKVQVSKTLLNGNGDVTGDRGANVSISHGLPKKYASVVTSGMTFTVPENGTNDIKLELSSK